MCDNTTAVNMINHMGTSHLDSCNSVANEMWEWCMDRKIWLSAAHILGKQILLQILNPEETKENLSGGLTTCH